MTINSRFWIVFMCLGFIANPCSGLAQSMDGYWLGEMEAGGRLFRFLLESAESKDAAAEVILVSWDEGHTRFSLQDFQLGQGELRFELPTTKAQYVGKLDPTGKIADGAWQQRGSEFPLRFEWHENMPVDKPTEIWEGTISVGFQKLVMRFRGYETGDSTRYFVDSVTQKVGGFIANGGWQDSTLELSIPALGGTFRGERSPDGDELAGRWSQGIPLDLVMQRVSSLPSTLEEQPPRPQTPRSPFPYKSQEVSFQSAANTKLVGTLTIPNGIQSPPLAILISGSGPQDRDSSVFEHRPFWVIADHLTRNGIAVLRFDERGVGQSEGDFSTATTRDFANDVSAAVQFARTLKTVDTEQIGLVGHSEGGLVAPWVAADDPAIAWIVLLAAPGVNGEEILYRQGQQIIEVEGGTRSEQERQRQIQERVIEVAKRWESDAETAERVKELHEKLLQEMMMSSEEEGLNWNDDDRQRLSLAIESSLKQMNSPWFRMFLTHEPLPVLGRVRCPVLALNGSLDVQVDPKINLPKIAQALRDAGNEQGRVLELPGLNHLFQSAKTGSISEYAAIEETIAPVVLEEITAWIQLHSPYSTKKVPPTK